MRIGTATRLKLLDVALRLFAERGVDAVSVRDIAAAAGVRPATLYVHWPSKEALVAELFAAGYAEYGRLLSAEARRDAPFAARLVAMVGLICQLHDEDQARFRFLLLHQHGHLHTLDIADDLNPIAVVQNALAAAMAAGDIAAGDPAVAAAAVVGAVVQAATFRLYGRIDRPLIDCADEIGRLALRALDAENRPERRMA